MKFLVHSGQLYKLMLCMLLACWLPSAQAAEVNRIKPYFPTAERLVAADSDYSVQAIMSGDELLGYVFETIDITPIPAYSGKPINLLVAITPEGKIVLAQVLTHSEPIMLVGIPESKLQHFAASHTDFSVNDNPKIGDNLDAISGATVTVIVVTETIMRAARLVAVSLGIIEDISALPPATVRADVFTPADWQTLIGDGSIRHLHLNHGQVDQAFVGTPAETFLRGTPKPADQTFIDLYYTYLNAPTVGRNLLGDTAYQKLMANLKPGEHAIALMATGDYSFKGSGYVRGGIFDRIEVIQGNRSITFHDLDHQRVRDFELSDMPYMAEKDIFFIRPDVGFDPGSPWQLDLLVRRASGPLDTEFTRFSGDYSIPDNYVDRPEPIIVHPIWVQVWYDKMFQIVVLGIGLLVLTAIMMFQDILVRFPRLLTPLRIGFLVYTVVFIGWYALAQLSVVNILTFTHSLMSDFSWSSFLIDPMMFILWCFVAISILLWGRGVYCGWLCPFGALQDLVNKAARKLKVKQIEIPFGLHERLWAIKYIILLVLFAISLNSLETAEMYAEVEPFKTAITLRFMRDWPFVLYAVALVAVSMFNHKFYCRYVCPLGAGLAIPSRLRLFDWLKRHRGHCGTPCQICANECEVKAIHPNGDINPNECHYCLDCQVLYWDSERCPPMIKRRRRYEKASRTSQKNNPSNAASAADATPRNIPINLVE